MEQIDLQLKAAAASLAGELFTLDVQRWVHVEGSDDKRLVTVLGVGSFFVYGSDENRLARLCTNYSAVPLKTAGSTTFSWRFGNQQKIAPNTPILASLGTYVARNRELWADLMRVSLQHARHISGL